MASPTKDSALYAGSKTETKGSLGGIRSAYWSGFADPAAANRPDGLLAGRRGR
jgi:hypothetical protein